MAATKTAPAGKRPLKTAFKALLYAALLEDDDGEGVVVAPLAQRREEERRRIPRGNEELARQRVEGVRRPRRGPDHHPGPPVEALPLGLYGRPV
mgnify:CR=1 FL=1